MKLENQKITYWATSIAIILIFTFIPYIGYLNFGIFNITLMIILLSILSYFWVYKEMCHPFTAGLWSGIFFGLGSFLRSWLYVSPSAIFMQNPLFSILPRTLVGIIMGLSLWLIFNKKWYWTIGWSFLITTVNTFITLAMLYFIGPWFFYSNPNIIAMIRIVLLTNYLPELILGCLIVPSAIKLINNIYKN